MDAHLLRLDVDSNLLQSLSLKMSQVVGCFFEGLSCRLSSSESLGSACLACRTKA